MDHAASHQETDQADYGDVFRPGETQMRPVQELASRKRTSPIAQGARACLLPVSRSLHATGHFLRRLVGKASDWSKRRGGPYIHTIAYEEEADASPYMTRIVWKRLRIHVFHRGDNDPDPHDHPWGFWTFPLVSYVEEVTFQTEWGYDKELRVVRALWPVYRPSSYTHRVLGAWKGANDRWTGQPAIIPGARIFTIVWRDGGRERDWGFLKDRNGKWCWQEWKIYHRQGGKHAPCE